MHVTILGGGGFRVPLIARQLAASGLPVSRVTLYDTDPGRLAVIARVLGGAPGPAGADGPRALPVATSTRLDEALRGADVIFAALRPGGLDGRVRDERDALALGVLGQETVGAGGLASAARTVPAVDAIARRIAELAPGAWVISMTNPAGIVTEVMAATLGRRVIGVCDSPVGLIRRACAAAGVDPGPSLGAVTDRVDADYLGINHLGWLRGLRAGGADLLPALLSDPGRLLLTEEGRLFGADLPRALGALPNEYLYWYYANHEALRDVLAAGRTRGEHVRERQQAFYAGAAGSPETAARRWQAANDERNRSYFAELRTGERAGDRDEADVAAGGYESVAVALASALTGGPAARLILNVPNGDTVAALAPGTVIEVPCRVDAGGAVPLAVSAPSAHELGLMSAVRACERDIADAALIASAGTGAGGAAGTTKEGAARASALALRAFAAHPLVGSLPAARSLAASALPTAVPPTTAILPSYPIDIIDFSPGPWLISFSRVLPLVKWKSASAVAPGLTAVAARRAEPHAGRPRLTGMRRFPRIRAAAPATGRVLASGRVLATCTVLAALAAGCGSVNATDPPSSPVAATGLTSAPAPARATPAQRAAAEAARMLTAFTPPPGARTVSRSPVPSSPLSAGPQGGRPSDDDVVTRTTWWLAPGGPQKLLSWEAAHIGAGDHRNGTGMNGAGVYNESFELPAVPGLFDERDLTVSATAAGHGQVAIRVDAMVDWIPERVPGDTVPATARVAVLTETRGAGTAKPQTVATATLTNARQVTALAAYLNGLQADLPGATYSCPGGIVGGGIAVTFRARPGGPSLAGATASFAGCSFLSFTRPGQKAAGIGGPSAGNDLVAEINRVAGLHWNVP